MPELRRTPRNICSGGWERGRWAAGLRWTGLPSRPSVMSASRVTSRVVCPSESVPRRLASLAWAMAQAGFGGLVQRSSPFTHSPTNTRQGPLTSHPYPPSYLPQIPPLCILSDQGQPPPARPGPSCPGEDNLVGLRACRCHLGCCRSRCHCFGRWLVPCCRVGGSIRAFHVPQAVRHVQIGIGSSAAFFGFAVPVATHSIFSSGASPVC